MATITCGLDSRLEHSHAFTETVCFIMCWRACVRDRFDCKWKIQETGTNYAGKKFKILGTAPDHSGLFTRLLGFAPDYWALHPTTGLFTRLLGFAPDYWALHPTTGLCTRLLGFCPTTRLLPENGAYTRILGCWDLPEAASDHPSIFSQPGTPRALSEGPRTFRKQCQTIGNDTQLIEIMEVIENRPIWLEMR